MTPPARQGSRWSHRPRRRTWEPRTCLSDARDVLAAQLRLLDLGIVELREQEKVDEPVGEIRLVGPIHVQAEDADASIICDRLAGRRQRGRLDPADAIEQRAQGICGLDVFFVGRIDSVEHGGDWEGLRRGIRLADPSGDL